MRWVERGPEPGGVAGYARQFTQGWVDYFQSGAGGRRSDSYWREFRPLLGSTTGDICWYCERKCYVSGEYGGRAPTVDHFRPISLFPQLAYQWSNWIFSCRRCNGDNKGDSWPESGYVDPCASDVTERPDRYFDYDALTGELIAKAGLSGTARQKALDTINDLGLNELDVRFYRLDWTRVFLTDLLSFPVSDRQAFIELFTVESVEYAGATGMVVQQLRRDGQI